MLVQTAGGEAVAAEMHGHAATAGQGVGGHLDGATQVGGPVGVRVVGGQLRAGEDHGPRVALDQVERERRFRHGVGAMGDHDAGDERVVKRKAHERNERIDVPKPHRRGVKEHRVVDTGGFRCVAGGDEFFGGERGHARARGIGGASDCAAGCDDEDEGLAGLGKSHVYQSVGWGLLLLNGNLGKVTPV